MQTARRGEPPCSPNFRNKPIASAKTSASSRSQSTRINHRPAAGEMLSCAAGRFHCLILQFFTKILKKKSQCGAAQTAWQEEPPCSPNFRDKPMHSAETNASARSQYAHKPSPRRRRNALPGEALAFSVLQLLQRLQHIVGKGRAGRAGLVAGHGQLLLALAADIQRLRELLRSVG